MMTGPASGETARVLALRADAIRLAGRRCLGLDLTFAEAARLAEGGSVALACQRLEERLPVRRKISGVVLDDAAQRQLAVAEVAAGLSRGLGGDVAGQRGLIRRLVDREVELHRSAEAEVATRRQIEAEMARLEQEEPRLRAFMRAAGRLYSRQRAALNEAIPDPSARSGALQRLDAVYAEHLDLAVTYGSYGPPQRPGGDTVLTADRTASGAGTESVV
jgi:hypothetical protein